MNYLGNKEILNNYKIGFLCSRKVPANIILKTYDWAIEQRDKGICVVSGFHSKIEKDVFDILIKGSQPIIIVLARKLLKRLRPELSNAIQNNRLLIVTEFSNKRISRQSAIKRNELIMKLSDEIFVAYAQPKGNLESLILKWFINDTTVKTFKGNHNLIRNGAIAI